MLRLACRRSGLAKAQAFQIGKLIAERTGTDFELVPLATTGDEHPDRAFADFDTKGLFVDGVRQAVLDGRADVVVHSYKDLPSEVTPGLEIAAIPRRADFRDLLVTREGLALSTLGAMATVGTSSERRRLQLLRTKPGLQVLPIRGNLPTRLGKVESGEFDAVVVAASGFRRLYTPPEQGGIGAFDMDLKGYLLEPGECLPAAAQGALGLEIRSDDDDARAAVKAVHHLETAAQVAAERGFAEALGGGCSAAIGALASLTGTGGLDLAGMFGDPARRRITRLSLQGDYRRPEWLGRQLAADVAAQAGIELVDGESGAAGGGN